MGSDEFSLDHVTCGVGLPSATHFKMAVWLVLTVVSTGPCSREGVVTFDAFLTRQASRSRGTRVTRHSDIPFQTHLSLRSYWSVFTRRSFWPGSPREAWSPSVSWFSPSSSVTFWSWSANYFIFSTDLVLQRAKLFFDEKFYFRDCLDQFLLRSVWWSSLFSWKGLFLICWLPS